MSVNGVSRSVRSATPLLAVVTALILAACSTAGNAPMAAAPGYVLMAGDVVPFGVSVITPLDAGGFDGRTRRRWFEPTAVLPRSPAAGCDTPSRASERRTADWPPERRNAVAEEGWTAELLRERVDLLVLHYDAAVASENCFRVLHDVRGLSVHFLLDVDGTLYQTLDLAARARHAGPANDRSIGIEIANPGAYDDQDAALRFHDRDTAGLLLRRSAGLGTPPGAPFRPARPEPVAGQVHGRPLQQVDFTARQYETLSAFVPALARLLPRIRRTAPLDAAGVVRSDTLTAEEIDAFSGVVGHHHLTPHKVDPGPALDWSRVLGREGRPGVVGQLGQVRRARTTASISLSSGNSPVSSFE